MGNNSPSRYRRQGRNAFVPHSTSPIDYFDCQRDSWNYKNKLKNFLDGWNEAEAEYESEQKRLENCPYENLRNKIATLVIDADLQCILDDIIDLIEEK